MHTRTLSNPEHLIYTFPSATRRGYLEWATQLNLKRKKKLIPAGVS